MILPEMSDAILDRHRYKLLFGEEVQSELAAYTLKRHTIVFSHKHSEISEDQAMTAGMWTNDIIQQLASKKRMYWITQCGAVLSVKVVDPENVSISQTKKTIDDILKLMYG